MTPFTIFNALPSLFIPRNWGSRYVDYWHKRATSVNLKHIPVRIINPAYQLC